MNLNYTKTSLHHQEEYHPREANNQSSISSNKSNQFDNNNNNQMNLVCNNDIVHNLSIPNTNIYNYSNHNNKQNISDNNSNTTNDGFISSISALLARLNIPIRSNSSHTHSNNRYNSQSIQQSQNSSSVLSNFMNIITLFTIFATMCSQITIVKSAADADNTDITDPVSGNPKNSTILSTTDSTVTITARDSTNTIATTSEIFFAELYSTGTCEVGYASSSCQVLCYPYNFPHDSMPQCTSYTSRFIKNSDSALWVIADVTSLGSGEYRIDYDDKVEVADTYDLSIYLLTNGGLRARYWDNIWMVDSPVITQIDSEIQFNWGTSAITIYGTDYVSVRWEGKIKPPYNETYTFFLYADDGARLWIDKILIADSWDKCCNETWGSVDLQSNAYHDIIVEYREIRGEAFIELRWSSASIAKTIVPSTYLYYQDHIQNSPYTGVVIGVGPVSYTLTTVNDETPFTSNTAGVNNSVYVTARDAFGQVVTTDSASFTLTNLDGANSVATWQGDGVYKITFESNTKTDNTTFNIKIGAPAVDILGSPYWVTVDPAETSPSDTELLGSGLSEAIAGQQATFNLTAFDTFGNERDEGTDDITVRFTGAEPGKGTCSYTNDGGVYNCEYTLTKTGLYTPIVEINTESAGPAPLPYVNVSSGSIHAPSCTIHNESTSIVAGTFEYFYIQARDQFGNVIRSQSDTFGVYVHRLGTAIVNATTNTMENTTTRITSTYTAIGAGRYNVTYTPLIKGDYTVSVRLSGVEIEGSPYDVTVIPGAVSASDSYVPLASNSNSSVQKATSNVEASFKVQTRDAQQNTLESDMGGFDTSSLSCDTVTTDVNCTYTSNGLYLCTYTPTESGPCSLSLEISGVDISGSPFSVFVNPGTIDADTTESYFISDGVAGIENTFLIQARDSYGNNLTSGGHTFYVNLVDRNNIADDVSGTITDNYDGTYSVSYITNVANIYESLRVELFQVGGLLGNYYTDYELTNVFVSLGKNIIDTTINFNWGSNIPLDLSFGVSDYFSIEWNGYLYPPYSETYTIYTPIYGNSGVKLYINNVLIIDNWDPALGDTDPFALIQLTQNTFYIIKLQFREQTGLSKISLEWNSPSLNSRQVINKDYLYYKKTINNVNYVSNVSIIPSSTSALQSIVTGDGRTHAIAGAGATVTIRAKDAYSNIQTDAGNEENLFNLTLRASDGPQQYMIGTVVDSGNNGADGLYTGSYNVTNATVDYTLEIYYNGIKFHTSTVKVDPGPISGNTNGASSGTILEWRAGEEQSFIVYLRDAYGNLCECGGNDNPIDINVNFTHSDGTTIVRPTSLIEADGGSGNGQGIYTVTFTATKNGLYTATIIAEHELLNGVTSEFNITDAVASTQYTYIKGWENGADTDISAGSATTQIIQVEDIYQNNITVKGGYNFYVTLTDSSDTVTRGTLTSLSDGRYELEYTASTAGIYSLSVQLASGDVNEPDGLTGDYYNNRWLYGSPLLTQIDSNITQNWGNGLVTTTAKDYVSVTWTGFIKPEYAQRYNFTIISDDGSRLIIDGTTLFDEFLSNAGTFFGYYTFPTANLLYTIQIDWRENTADADIALYWNSTSQTNEEVPTSALFSSATDIQSSPFSVTAT